MAPDTCLAAADAAPPPVADPAGPPWAPALRSACDRIMPAWPLDQAVAVNPHWRRIGAPIRQVAARLAVLGDVHVFPPRSLIRQEWEAGRIAPPDLALAVARQPRTAARAITEEHCLAQLGGTALVRAEPLLVDLLDDAVQKNRRWPWRAAIVFQISQVCAAYFDRHQAEWRAAGSPGLYGFWRESIQGDHGLGARLGLPGLMTHIRQLPPQPAQAMTWALDRLGLPAAAWPDYFESLLLSINGWAAWCAYIAWQKAPAGQSDARLGELLACRLAWEALLSVAVPEKARAAALARFQSCWLGVGQRVAEADAALVVDEIWQHALDISVQRDLARILRAPVAASTGAAAPAPDARPEVQAVFCIDTRSERMRRALESIWPAVQTCAFAGFFGLPMAYTPLGAAASRPQLPGLAYPSMVVHDVLTAPGSAHADPGLTARAAAANRRRLAGADQWLDATRWPNTTFSFVEAFGVGYVGRIARWILPSAGATRPAGRRGSSADRQARRRPLVQGLDIAQQVDLAADILHAMGLDDRLAPLVILCGHGSHSTNNAHASTLDCGACHGRPGDANARALALMLNQPPVRAGLRARGLAIPEDTVFMGALHNTTTDEITGFDLDLLPPAARARWAAMARVFAQAGDRVRRERAPSLGMAVKPDAAALLKDFRRRARDGAQTRPEWGLTRNAALVIGPRARTRGRVLDRVYLHDYDARFDPDGQVLEKLMLGPLLVTHWLSWQYHASSSDPVHYGAGNKVLHNVVDGHIGVFEGNGGDLRIGLPRQSLHDGRRWVHQPVRLTVLIDAPAASIAGVVARHTVLRQLCDNGWLWLWRYEGDALQQYAGGAWRPVPV
ncbi:YbcC family protein [Castellaniella hirudinis]|uniref:YbcC family protein n=1 Tax=Castellaniella hirudinis TaxID=1144617 RepID=UPI0039C1E180